MTVFLQGSMLMIKYKKEWPELVKLATAHTLEKERTLFLLALREVESGKKNQEFNVKAAKGTSLKEQALWAIGSIKKNDERWQNYIRDQSYVDYIKFFAWYGGPYGTGWCPLDSGGWIDNIKQSIEEVRFELEGNPRVVEDNRP
jgi:hypothetical protein